MQNYDNLRSRYLPFIGPHVRLSRNSAHRVKHCLTRLAMACLVWHEQTTSSRPRRPAENLPYPTSDGMPIGRLHSSHGDLFDTLIYLRLATQDPNVLRRLAEHLAVSLAPRLTMLSTLRPLANPSRRKPFFLTSFRLPQLALMSSRQLPTRRLAANCNSLAVECTLPSTPMPLAGLSKS